MTDDRVAKFKALRANAEPYRWEWQKRAWHEGYMNGLELANLIYQMTPEEKIQCAAILAEERLS